MESDSDSAKKLRLDFSPTKSDFPDHSKDLAPTELPPDLSDKVEDSVSPQQELEGGSRLKVDDTGGGSFSDHLSPNDQISDGKKGVLQATAYHSISTESEEGNLSPDQPK